MSSVCRIEVLGGLRVVRADRTVVTRFRTHKAAGVLAYLALHRDRPQTRDHLCDRFWPERDALAGRKNLTTALTSLRRELEAPGGGTDGIFLSDQQTVGLHPDRVSTDAADWERLVRLADATDDLPERARLLEQATDLYRGAPLPGRYEDWALDLQNGWAERQASALDHLCETREALRDWEGALRATERAIAQDALRETPRRVQMRAYAGLGRVKAALEAYETWERLLQTEMGVAPAPTTRALADQIRRDPHALGSAPPTGGASAPDHAAPVPAAAPTSPSLPPQFTRFFGREAEIAHLATLLRPGGPRLVTLLGPGGVGKTRLSIEAARHVAPLWRGRVWFVELASLPDPALILPAVVGALGLPPAAQDVSPLDRLVDALRDEPGLLILDNAEHLLPPSPFPSDKRAPGGVGASGYVRLLLERLPRLSCLVTSRHPLHLGGEQQFPVEALGTPADQPDRPDELLRLPSIRLYADRARLVQPRFAVTPANAPTVAALCRRLDGMPLAIEMAAAWARTVPPALMLERLERQISELAFRRGDMPARHRSLRAAIAWSVDLLPRGLQTFLTRLSVFHGGWTPPAAQAICREPDDTRPDTLELLTELAERSLVVVEERDGETRFRLLETVREWGVERLKESNEEEALRRRHAGFFRDLATGTAVEAQDTVWLTALQRDHANLRAALEWHLRADDVATLEDGLRFAAALRYFWDMRHHWAEGAAYYARILARTRHLPPSDARIGALQGACDLARLRGDTTFARASAEESAVLARARGDTFTLANALYRLGLVQEDALVTARPLFEESVALLREIEKSPGASPHAAMRLMWGLISLGINLAGQGDASAARSAFNEALARATALNHTQGRAGALFSLGLLDYEDGDYAGAEASFRAADALDRQIGPRSGHAAIFIGFAALKRGDLPGAERQLEHCVAGSREIASGFSLARALQGLGQVRLAQGDGASARACWGEALAIADQIDNKPLRAELLEAFAQLIADAEPRQAVSLLGTVDALRTAIHFPVRPGDRAAHEQHLTHLRETLGDAAFETAWAGGQTTPPEQATFALLRR